MERTVQGNDFELILKVKNGNYTSRRGINFGSEFPAFCKHCGVMAA